MEFGILWCQFDGAPLAAARTGKSEDALADRHC